MPVIDYNKADSEMPEFGKEAFNCPHCGAYAHQHWGDGIFYGRYPNDFKAHMSMCVKCGAECLWVNEKLALPDTGGAPLAHPDMPYDVKADYEEAASIVHKSPRAAAALLRLALEKLCTAVGAKGNTLQEKIDSLVEKRLDARLIKVMDAIRVIGNEAVHPGTLDLRDDAQTVNTLFGLINFIVEELITKLAAMDSFYESAVPDSKKRKNMPPENGAAG